LEIIPATQGHVPQILELWKEFEDFHKEIDSFFTRSKDGHVKFGEFVHRQMDSEDSLVLVAVNGKDVIAYSISRISKHPPVFELESYGDIIDLAVTSTDRRRGIGTEMLGKIYEWFKSRGMNRVELRVAVRNQIGYSFWKKHGFQDYIHTLYRLMDEA